MFHVLIESGAHPGERRAGWTVTSAAVHAGLIAMAVALTLRAPKWTPRSVEDIRPVTIWRQPETRSQERAGESPGPVVAPPSPEISIPTIYVDGPHFGYGSVASWNPRDLDSIGGLSGFPGSGTTDVYTGNTVDRPVVPRSDNGSPIYPTLLRSAGVEGDVAVRYVVDSTGRVEINSIALLETTHAAFAEAVGRWLLKARYLPAEVNGRPVRQLVEQRFGFTLRR